MKQKHIAVMVKHENIMSSITPNRNGTYTVDGWTIARDRLGHLRTISLHKDHNTDSYTVGRIVGYLFDENTNKTSVIYRAVDEVVAADDLAWGARQSVCYL